MPNWPALLVAPTLALTNLSITYALVTPSCARQDRLALNAVSAIVLLVCLVFSWQAWRNWRMAPARAEPGDAAAQRKPFVALVACMVGALSCLVVLAQWFPQWILSPCAS